LAGNDDWHRFAVDRAGVGIAQLAPDGTLREVNPGFCRLLGAPANALLGRRLEERVHPEDEAGRAWAARAGAAEADDSTHELRFDRPDGSTVWLELSRSVARDPAGRPRFSVCVAHDVSSRRSAERALRRRVATFFHTFDAAPAPMLQSDPETGRFLRVNARFCELTGYSETELLEMTLEQITHPEDRGADAQKLSGFTPERRYLRKDGSAFWAILYATPMYHDAGGVFRTLSAWVDVSERKRAEEALRFSEARFRTLVEAGPFMAYTSDEQGMPSYLGPSLSRFLGLEVEQVRSDDVLQQIVHPEDFERIAELRAPKGDLATGEIRLRRADGAWRWFLARTVALLDEEGRFLQRIGSLTDIHDRKRAEAVLREDDRRKDEFLATLAHELRNPLGSIRNSVEVLRLCPVEHPDLDWARGMIDRQVDALTRLVDDLLEVSRITRGTLSLRMEKVELAELFRDVVEASRPLLARHGHRLDVRLPPEPIFLRADPVRLAQVLANLLDNAAKHSASEDSVQLAAERDGGEVVLSVSDRGRGMTPEELSRVFEMFYQAGDRTQRAGLGVGLALVKRLVELHDGSVAARSEGLGRGSSFHVRLPLLEAQLQPAPARPVAPPPVTKARRVLVVDDNPDSTASLAALVKMLGHDVETAADGIEAFEAAERFRPAVVLLDLGMPRLDGYGAARRIRAAPWGGDTLLVAQTGWGQETDRRLTREAGFDFHLTKPVDVAALRKILAEAREPA
jgi:PAS domain S-box-containing protein